MLMNLVVIGFIAFVLYGMCKDEEVEHNGKINKAR